MNKKSWQNCLLAELIFLLIFWSIKTYHLAVHDSDEIYNLIYPLIIAAMLVLYIIRDHQPELVNFIKWLLLILFPAFAIETWGQCLEFLTKQFAGANVAIALVFFLIYLVIFLPLVVVEAGNVNWTIPRLLVTGWLMEEVFSEPGDFKVYGSKFLTTTISSGILSALTFFIMACFLLKAWDFSWNPNLKFIRSKNFSWFVYAFLLIFAVFYVAFNDFGGSGDTIWEMLVTYSSAPIKLTYNSFAEAAEAGILEETVRFLNIIALLYGMRKWKHKASWAIFFSALMFGLMHLSNFGWQKLAPTIQQVVLTFGAGLFLGTLYLYTGKIWLSMLMHFSLDFLIFIQAGGTEPGTWVGDASDWLATFILLALPVAVYLWMLFGKRNRVLEENGNRLLAPAITMA